MTQETIQAIVNFMGRTSLKGEEVGAFNECMQALHKAFEEAGAGKEEVCED